MVIRMNDKIEMKSDKIKKDKYLEHCPYNIQKAIAAQEKFCNDHNVPLFAPTDGRCFKCGDNIYSCRSHKIHILRQEESFIILVLLLRELVSSILLVALIVIKVFVTKNNDIILY